LSLPLHLPLITMSCWISFLNISSFCLLSPSSLLHTRPLSSLDWSTVSLLITSLSLVLLHSNSSSSFPPRWGSSEMQNCL
jgi:hypothetical protein